MALLGRNGAGKTTLLRILAGLSKPSEGSVRVDGTDVRAQQTRRRIGVLGHGISLYDELSATENLRIFAQLYGYADPAKTRVGVAGAHGAGTGPRRAGSRIFARHAAAAGGGAGFLARSEVLLFDEPFTALDDRAIAVLQCLLQRRACGRAHHHHVHPSIARGRLATHVALIQRGQLVYAGRAHAGDGRRSRLAVSDLWRQLMR